MKSERRKGDNPYAPLFSDLLSAEGKAEYKKFMIAENLLRLMEQQNITRTELASRMGVQPSRVTALLSGSGNLTIETLVRAGMALGAELHQTFVPAQTDVSKSAGASPTKKTALLSHVADKPTRHRIHKSK